MGEHQAAGSWANADHVGKRGSSLEIHDSGAARVGYPQELPTRHQKDKSNHRRRLVGLILTRIYTETATSHSTENMEAHTPE